MAKSMLCSRGEAFDVMASASVENTTAGLGRIYLRMEEVTLDEVERILV